MKSEETILDALRWVQALIERCESKYEPEKALEVVRREVESCVALGEDPSWGTRFKEATEQLKRPGYSWL